MIRYELRKLLGNRFLLISLALLLLLNCGVSYYTATESRETPVSDAQKEFLIYYLNHTEEAEAYAAEIDAFQKAQLELEIEAIRNGEEYEAKKYPNRYNIDGLTDEYLIRWARDTVNSAGSYRADIAEVIDRAKRNLAELQSQGYGDSYAANYQREVIREYREILDSGLQIGLESDHGWNAYYNYAAGDLLLFAFVMILASALFLQEKQSGFWGMIRTTRRGRMETGVSKLATLGISVTVALLLFAGSSFAVYGLICGYSSPHNVLQVLDSFRLSNLQITVGQYLSIHLLLKWSSALVFGAVVVLISLFFNHPAAACSGSVVVFGSQYLLRFFPYLDADNPFRNLNLLTVSESIRLTGRLRTLDVFGSAQPALLCWAIVAVILLVGAMMATLFLYAKGYLPTDRPSIFRKLFPKGLLKLKLVRFTVKRRQVKGKIHSLFTWEAYKRLITDRILPVILLLLVVKCIVTTDGIGEPLRYREMIYREYMILYAGEWTEEKSAEITAKAAEIKDTVRKYDEMQTAHSEGTITNAEYEAFLEKYYDAAELDGFFDMIVMRDKYLRSVTEETEITPAFVYDTGWNAFLGANSDLWLYFALLLLTCGIFSGEYQKTSSSGGFAPLLRTTVKGRQKTFRTKLLFVLIGTFVLTALFTAVDFAAVAAKYALPGLSESVASLETFAGLPATWSIGQYAMLYLTTKLLMALLFTWFVFALSAVLEKTLTVMSISLALTLLPSLLVNAGLPLEAVDFQVYFAATPVWLAVMTGGAEWIILTAGAILTAILYPFAKRRYI